jgi:hypothetical protein
MSGNEGDTVARGVAPSRRGVQVTIDRRRSVEIVRLTLLGRDPQATPDEHGATLVALDDPTRAMSKTHLALTARDGHLWAMDRGSVNGTTLRGPAGDIPLPALQWVQVAAGSTVLFGDSQLTMVATSPAPPSSHTVQPLAVPTAADLPWSPSSGTPASTGTSPWAPMPTPVAGVEPVPPIDRVPSAPPSPTVLPVTACAVCHRALQPGDRFCDGCGTPVGSAAPIASGASAGTDAPTTASWPQAPLQPQPAASASGAGRSRRLIGAAAAGVVVVGAGLFLVLRVGPDRGAGASSSGTEAAMVPTDRPEVRWTADVEGAVGATRFGDAVYVGSATYDVDDGEARLVRLDVGDGSEVWNTDLDLDYVDDVEVSGALDGTLIVQAASGDHATIFGVDAASGDVLWDEDGWYASVFGGHAFIGGDGSLEQIDPKTGARVAQVKADVVEPTLDGNHLVALDGGSEVTVYDAGTMDLVVGPFDVDEDAADVGYTGDEVVVAVEDELRFYDDQGQLVRTSLLDVDVIYSVEVIAADDFIVAADDETLAVTPTAPRAEQLWTVDGFPSIWPGLRRSGSTDLVPVYASDDSSTTLVELDSGKRRLTVGDENSYEMFGRDAVVSVDRDDDGGIDDVTAYAYADGAQLWTLNPGGDSAWLVDGGLVTADDDGVSFSR